MRSYATDPAREPAGKHGEAPVPSRAPLPADGPDKALELAGAMGNQALLRRSGQERGLPGLGRGMSIEWKKPPEEPAPGKVERPAPGPSARADITSNTYEGPSWSEHGAFR